MGPSNRQRLRVTFVLPSVRGNLSGGARVVATFADRLQRRGHTVNLVSLPEMRLNGRKKLKSLLGGWGRPKGPQDSYFDGISVPHRVLESVRPVIDDDVPHGDVVVATWWQTAEWVAKLSPRKGAKAYFIQHHEVFDYLPIERVKATWRLPLHKITVSKWLVELAAQEYGDQRVWLAPDSIDTDLFRAPPRGRQTQPTVGLLYSTVEWKGLAVSLRAIELVRNRIPGLRVVAFGAEPVAEHLPLPTNSTFHYRPSQSAIPGLYASCDVWLCGSYVEGNHLPPREAMACRCPVVSTSVGGPVDVIETGKNGFLVPVGNAEMLANRLFDVLNLDEVTWRVMSDAALAAVTRYTWDDATNLFENALNDVIKCDSSSSLQ